MTKRTGRSLLKRHLLHQQNMSLADELGQKFPDIDPDFITQLLTYCSPDEAEAMLVSMDEEKQAAIRTPIDHQSHINTGRPQTQGRNVEGQGGRPTSARNKARPQTATRRPVTRSGANDDDEDERLARQLAMEYNPSAATTMDRPMTSRTKQVFEDEAIARQMEFEEHMSPQSTGRPKGAMSKPIRTEFVASEYQGEYMAEKPPMDMSSNVSADSPPAHLVNRDEVRLVPL
jgi:hypothetical protein